MIIILKVRKATPTPTRPIEIAKREDPDLRKGLGSIYKPIQKANQSLILDKREIFVRVIGNYEKTHRFNNFSITKL